MSDQEDLNPDETPRDEDFEPTPPVRGVLSYPPLFPSLLPLSFVYLSMAVFSGLYWNYPKWHLATSYNLVMDNGLWYTLLTAVFVHSDVGHILSNTPMLIVFGYYLHGYFGWKVFPLSTLLIGTLTNYFTIQSMPTLTKLVGASGMVYAMVAMWLVYYICFEIRYTVVIRIVRAFAFALLMMFPTVYHPTTSYKAHAIGFLLGLIFALISLLWVRPHAQESVEEDVAE